MLPFPARWFRSFAHPTKKKAAVRARSPRRRRLEIEALEARVVPSAMISTNLPDYAPGSTAVFTGTGFQAGETVDLQVLHTDGLPNTGPGQTPWQTQADASGNFTTSWYVTFDSIDSSLQVTASGETSADIAQASFTDHLTGAIFTTNFDGSRVNQNIYPSQQAVYLNGGPDKSGSGLPDGQYYFQVTDPSGNTLLSTDDISQREVQITNGIITEYLGSTHATNTNPETGAVTVQLMPYDVTPNSGGEYKVWMTPVRAYNPSAGNFGFVENDSKTDNFKVEVSTPTLTTTSGGDLTLGTGASTLTDSADLEGGYNPGGNITFTLTYNNTVVDTETVNVHGNGIYNTPTGYTLPTNSTVTGIYQWLATYNGDGNNNSAHDQGGPAEQQNVDPAGPSLTSTSGGDVTLGTSAATLTDSADLEGGYNPGGTITFTLTYGNTVVDTETVNVHGNGVYNTPTGYTLPTNSTVTGIYQWLATYNGDGNNNSAHDQGGTAEQQNVDPASPSLVSTSGGDVTLGTSAPTLTDSADLEGGYNPGGNITFTLTYNNNVVDTETVNVHGSGIYNTPTGYTLPTNTTVTGMYQWLATYNGDGNNNSAHDQGGPAEHQNVDPASPSLVSTSGGDVTLGNGASTLTDSADLEGGYNPGGTITFTLTYNNTTVDTETVAVHGNGIYNTPTGYTLPTNSTVTGIYQWLATYNGDGNNNSAHDQGGTGEQQVVSAASPTLVTTAGGNLTLGTGASTLTDSADLEGGYNPGGIITFTLTYKNNVVDTETVAVHGNGIYNTPTGYTLPTNSTVTGIYQWLATYNGDGNNNSAHDQGGTGEQQVVSAASPTLVTTAGGNLTLGTGASTLTDSADLEGGYNPGGTITFTLTYGNNVVDTETVNVHGNGIYSTPTGYTLPTNSTVTGIYQWLATYSGDGNNNSAHDQGGTGEQQVVSAASPALVTTAGGNLTLGTGASTLTDSADLEGGYNPGGTITFTLTYNNNVVDTETVNVHGNGIYNTPTGYTLPTNSTVTGIYQWHASYNGDGNNKSAVDQGGTGEQQVVSAASPTLVTTAGGNLTLGTGASTLTDSADLEGGYNPGGIITFTLTYNNTTVDTETVAVHGNGVYNTPTGYTLPTNSTVTGIYQWHSNYNGDGNNNSAVDQGGTGEQQVVSAASPTLVTTAGGNLTLGTSAPKLTDSADLEGGYNPGGTITFTLTYGNTIVDTETVNVHGNGVYNTPTGYTLPTNSTVTGIYQWHASYNGDGNNKSATDQGGTAEQQVVSAATPKLVTTAGGVVTVGTGVSMTDSATLSGSYFATGSITFTLHAPNGTTAVYASTVAVHGNGTYSASGYLPPSTAAAGLYHWVATFNGDGNNHSAIDQGGAAEQEELVGYSTGTPKTLGFWGNNNGKAVLQAHDSTWRAIINSLNLRTANGSKFTVSTTASFASAYASFTSWLGGANATNMAYMLSAQLATMELNVAFEGLSVNTMLYIGTGSAINSWSSQGSNLMSNLNAGASTYGLTGTNASGFISIGTLMNDATAMLANYGTATSTSAARVFEEALKIVLDAANNNQPIYA